MISSEQTLRAGLITGPGATSAGATQSQMLWAVLVTFLGTAAAKYMNCGDSPLCGVLVLETGFGPGACRTVRLEPRGRAAARALRVFVAARARCFARARIPIS